MAFWKVKKDHTSIRRIDYGTVFAGIGGPANMSHIDGGAYDRVRYDVYGKTTFNVDVIGESDNGYGVYDLSKSRDGVVGFSPHG